jgi:hypothetical protein
MKHRSCSLVQGQALAAVGNRDSAEFVLLQSGFADLKAWSEFIHAKPFYSCGTE